MQVASAVVRDEPSIALWKITELTHSIGFIEFALIVINSAYSVVISFSVGILIFAFLFIALFAAACWTTHQAIRVKKDHRWLFPILGLNCVYLVFLGIGLLLKIVGVFAGGWDIVVGAVIGILIWLAFTFVIYKCFLYMKP